jgi:hypothetical protein
MNFNKLLHTSFILKPLDESIILCTQVSQAMLLVELLIIIKYKILNLI